jgi:hypothetical protein
LGWIKLNYIKIKEYIMQKVNLIILLYYKFKLIYWKNYITKMNKKYIKKYHNYSLKYKKLINNIIIRIINYSLKVKVLRESLRIIKLLKIILILLIINKINKTN